MGKYTYKTASLVLAALLLPISAWAAGLGKLTVLSALGQPLKAEIEIVSLQAGEAEGLSARLAPQEAFRQANIELPSALFSLKFAIERRAEGRGVVSITSAEPMNEPFIDMLVELNWSAGKLVREYTFLLDPPEYKGPAVAAAPAAPAAVAPAAESIPVPAPQPPEARAPMRAEKAPPAAAGTYEVKRGDTLSGIARRNMAEGATLSQMLVALYRGNREVFDGDNMNRLRAGRILNLSTAETALAVSAEEAQRLIATQSADYGEYRRRLAAAVAAAPARADAGRQVAGRIGGPEAEKPVTAPEPTKDQLRLTKAGDAAAGGRAGAAARGDDLAAKEKALKEANERIALLEKNVADLQKLAQLKSEAGAQLQQAAKAQAAAKAEVAREAAAARDAPAPAAKAEAAKAPEPARAEAAVAATDAAKAAPDVAKAAPKAAPKPVVAPPPPPPPSFVDELLENEIALGGAGGVIVLLAGYAVYAWQRKRKEQAERSLLGSGAAGASSAFGASGGRQVDTAASASFQSDFGHEGIGKIDTEEIDPVAEADVYMAYGRDAQAEEILKEALAKDPGRHAARVKLLEVYANRKDRRAFEATATELYAATNGQGPEWEKAASLGIAIDPDNPLYGGKAAAAPDMSAAAVPGAAAAIATQVPAAAQAAAQAEATPASALDFDLDLSAAAAAAAPAAAEVGAPAEAGGGLDFDLDLGAPAAEAAPAEAAVTAQAETGLDFDLDLGVEAKPAESAPAGVAAGAAPGVEPAKAAEGAQAPAGDELAIDFDIGAEISAPAEKQEVQVAAAAESGGGLDFDIGLPSETPEAAKKEPALDSISLDLGESAGSGAPALDAHWQEVATKLDLAKAYEEMGDRDGSRELLNEVIAEGDAAQQQQARTMLEAFG